jgi:hypothetical protein
LRLWIRGEDVMNKSIECIEPAKIATEWVGFDKATAYYLRLNVNGTGACVYLHPCDPPGAVLTVKEWSVDRFTLRAFCEGVTFPDETITITGSTYGFSVEAIIRGKNSYTTLRKRKVTFQRVEDVLLAIAVGRDGSKEL